MACPVSTDSGLVTKVTLAPAVEALQQVADRRVQRGQRGERWLRKAIAGHANLRVLSLIDN